MQKLMIIGNLTNNPELRITQSGKKVCSFGVAVNRRRSGNGQQEADFFRVSAWEKLGENCSQYLSKGKKVSVVGEVSVRVYTTQGGEARATMEVLANDIEFLSPKSEGQQQPEQPTANAVQPSNGFVEVDSDELPF